MTPVAEEALRREQAQHEQRVMDSARLRRLFEQFPALISVWDRDLRNIFANRGFIDLFGLMPDDVVGRHMRDVLGETAFELNRPHVERALAGQEQVFTRTRVDPVGRTRHSQISYAPDTVDGEVRGLFVLVTDVTDRVEAQRELDDAQHLAKVASWVFYPRTGTMTWSREMYRFVGQDPDRDAPTVEALLAAVHPEDLARVTAWRDAAAELTADDELSFRMVDGDRVRHVHSRGRPEFDQHGTLSRITGTMQDETELQEAATRLTRSNQVLADTIAMLGHDVKQPVQGVQGYLDLVIDGWHEDAPGILLNRVERAAAGTRRLTGLLDDVLTMAKVDSGALSTRPSGVWLADLVTEVVTDTVPGDVTCGLSLDREAVAMIDRFQIRQVVTNLLTNALRYGAAPFEVSVRCTDAGTEIRVADHGEGVPADFVPKLFDRFSRASTGVAASKSGSGFGLHIARELVIANGGSLTYAPVEPTGASFVVALPAPPAESDAASA